MIHILHHLVDGLHWHPMLTTFPALMPDDWVTLAQSVKDTDLMGDVSKAWNHFVKTGQVWAFLLGAIFGYLAKTFTTYG
jgi:hypothetical protein